MSAIGRFSSALVPVTLILAAGGCSRNLEVWQVTPGGGTNDSLQTGALQLTRLKGIPFYVKEQRYKYTHAREYRWYKVTLKVTPLFQSPQPNQGRPTAEPETGTPTTYVYEVPLNARESLYAILDTIRKNTESAGGAPSKVVDSIEHRLQRLSRPPYHASNGLRGSPYTLGMTIEPIVVVDYHTRYYINTGRSLGATELGVKLSEDGSLGEVSGKTAGNLREITGAIGDLATPAGGILSGIGTIAAGEEALRSAPGAYRIETTAKEVGYRERYVLVSRDSSLSEESVRSAPGHSMTGEWFEGGEPEAKSKDSDKSDKLEFEGSVRLPKPPAKEEDPKGNSGKAKP